MEVIIQELSNIVIPERRHRKTFIEADIKDLATSISTYGLFHAPVVLADGMTLVAGERRLRAMTYLYDEGITFSYNEIEVEWGHIPVVKIATNSKWGIREAELSENIDRVNLSWREKSSAVEELHSLRNEEKQAATGEQQTKIETAKELYPEEVDSRVIEVKLLDVSKDLIVAQFLDDPEVAKTKNRSEALKVITKKLETKRRIELGKEFDLSKDSGDHQIILGDVFEELSKLEENQISCIVTDPPYGIGADAFTNQKSSKHSYKDDAEYGDAVAEFILEEGYRLTKKRAHLYMFVDINKFLLWKVMAEKLEWYVWPKPLIWFRGVNSGIAPRPDHGPRNTYEAIMYCIKGDKEIKVKNSVDVINIPHERGIDYAAHKPADLYAELIKRSCEPGDFVLDPVCGSGPIFGAAGECSVTAIGIDNSKVAISLCYERLKGE